MMALQSVFLFGVVQRGVGYLLRLLSSSSGVNIVKVGGIRGSDTYGSMVSNTRKRVYRVDRYCAVKIAGIVVV